MNIVTFFLKNLWFNAFIILILGVAIFHCIRLYRKGLIAYKYYANFIIGLLAIWIIQIFQRLTSPRSISGLLIGLFIFIIFIFSLVNFYLGHKKERQKNHPQTK